MGLLDLFVVASIPVVKVLLLTATGLFLALDRVGILGDHARNHLNKVVFYVFNPSLVAANLAKTLTVESFLTLEAAIPCLTIILGANLLQGLKGSGIQLREVIGIVIAGYIVQPLVGIVIVKGAVHVGAVPCNDKLFVFLLHIQYALPPAMNIVTITQLFGAGQSECSVIMLWAYALASVSLTLWSTFFLWILT